MKNKNVVTGYRLSNSFLDKEYKKFLKNKTLYSIEFSFQEYIESVYAPTKWLKDWFIKNLLPFDESLSDKLSNDRKIEISFDKLYIDIKFI